ncbi:hypothetical protein Tco_1334743 [Tanacetum coccineum]
MKTYKYLRHQDSIREMNLLDRSRKSPTVELIEVNSGRISIRHLIVEYLVNISKRRAFWSLNEDILKINDSDNQYAVSIKEDTVYPCLHSPKTTKETSSIRRIQKMSIRRIEDIEEEAEAMAETMEQYMSKTRTDYGSGVARPKIEEKDSFELKGQFLKELRENTFSGSDNEDANEHIEKVLEIVDYSIRWLRNEPTGSIKTWEDLKTKFLNKYCPPGRTAKKMEEINNFQQEPDETLYQAWERFKELLMKCPQHYLTEMQETAADAKKAIHEMAEYSQKWHNGTSRGRSGGYRETAPGFYQRNSANPSYQERRKSMEDTLSKFMGESSKIHEENSNLIKEIRASMDAAIRK